MNRNTRTNTLARHFYVHAYADYLRSGDLEQATRAVAQQIFQARGKSPGTPQGDWQEAERITREWPRTITDASQAHVFDKVMAKTRQWLKEVELELGCDNPNDAYRALKAVLHAVRDRLPLREGTEFAAQLPLLMIGIYYSGWTPADKPEKIRSLDEFLDKVAEQLPKDMEPLQATRGVIAVIERHVSAGEIKDVRRNFPERMQELWDPAGQTTTRD